MSERGNIEIIESEGKVCVFICVCECVCVCLRGCCMIDGPQMSKKNKMQGVIRTVGVRRDGELSFHSS